jgi:hypothetical protein
VPVRTEAAPTEEVIITRSKPRPTDSGLPRNSTRDDTREGIAHTHSQNGEIVDDFHPRGNLPHDHGPAGNVVFKGSPQPITTAYARPNLGHPDPEGFLEDHLADPTPPVSPGETALEPSDAVSGPASAGSGDGGSGRPTSAHIITKQSTGAALAPRDAREAVLGAAMGVINPVADPVADPAFQIRHAEESARVLIIGQHVGNMFQAIADKQFVANADLRAAYRKLRQIADFHDIDLDDDGEVGR